MGVATFHIVTLAIGVAVLAAYYFRRRPPPTLPRIKPDPKTLECRCDGNLVGLYDLSGTVPTRSATSMCNDLKKECVSGSLGKFLF